MVFHPANSVGAKKKFSVYSGAHGALTHWKENEKKGMVLKTKCAVRACLKTIYDFIITCLNSVD